ncbi:MAG TPA: FtsX-like permease family protein [Candidatus Brocadiia bacterium]|nr:FtsX-like permease family protein [Candidatus Brocadiia bacterium]
MSIARLLVREILHRKLNFLLGTLAATLAVGLIVSALTMSAAADLEIKRLMRNMGFNLVIVPKDTNMEDFWAKDFAESDMPEEYVRTLSGSPEIQAEHYVAILKKRVKWNDRQILLCGLLPEIGNAGKARKDAMGYIIECGTVYIGFEIARNLGLKSGQRIELLGREMEIVRCLGESGSKDDITIFAHLHDAQEILGMKGRINEIKALGCLCFGKRVGTIREDIARKLPDTRVTEFESIAIARAETRAMMEKYAAFFAPLVLIVCAAWIGVLALLNVRERRVEIGVLRAIGSGTGRIAVLFLGKAALIGALGGALGFALGTGLALRYGPEIFRLTAAKITPIYDLLWWSLAASPFVAALSSAIPTMIAVTQDPAATLTEQ